MLEYSLEQLGLFITLLLSGTSGLLLVCYKSRCTTISCFWDCCKIDRQLTVRPPPPPENPEQDILPESNP